jgi:parallel beta-helix repeat protein
LFEMRMTIVDKVLIIGLLAPASAQAADYWVAPNGSDSADGSATAPWATIQHAADTMQPGDSATVTDGTYAGFWMKNRAGDAQHRFTFRAQHPLGAQITGPSATASDPNDSIQLVSVSFATIDGFDVTGAPRAGISIRTFGDDTGADTTDNIVQNCRSHNNGAGVTAGRHDGIFTGFAQNIVVQNNEVDHNSEHGIYVSNSADNPVIRGNHSHDNAANGIQINGDASTGGDGVISHWLVENNVVAGNGGASAINLDGATFGALRNNLVYGNAKGGIALFMGDSAEASHDNVVVDNTVFDPQGSRFAIQIDNGADNNVVFDNVFWSASSGMELGSVNGLVHDYNVVSSYVGGSASAHESTPDPTLLFVNTSSNDYHPGPALLGQGTGSMGGASAPALDLDGNPRPQGGTYDIGCYEHSLDASSAPPGSLTEGGTGLSPSTADAANAPPPPVTDAGTMPSAKTDAASVPPGQTDAASATALDGAPDATPAAASGAETTGAPANSGNSGNSANSANSTMSAGAAPSGAKTSGCSVSYVESFPSSDASSQAKAPPWGRDAGLIFFVAAALVRPLRRRRSVF